MADVLVLHPGAMGSAVGRCLVANGHRAHWVSQGRSEASRSRAGSVGLIAHDDLPSALDQCSVVLSVCPPDNAIEVASAVAASASAGGALVFVDCNAVAPVTARALASILTKAGVAVVDGGIVGPPPYETPAGQPESTRLFVSGDRADEVADLFGAGTLGTVVVDGGIGAASALKMVFAAWTKGSAALMLEVVAAARAHGVEQELFDEWSISRPSMMQQVDRAAEVGAPRAWRWKGEMEEIAATMAEVGLPAGMPLGAAEVYRRLAAFDNGGFKDRSPAPLLGDVVAGLLAGG